MQLIIEVKRSGVFYRFEKADWNIGARPLIAELKKKCKAEYLPIEKPEDECWWYCRLEYKDKLFELKKDFIDRFKNEKYNFIPRKRRWR